MPLAVLPWFQLPTLELGPFTIQSFGILSAIGILVAVQLSARTAAQLGRDPKVIVDYAVPGVLSGIVGGHLVHLLFYHREELFGPGVTSAQAVWRLLKVWEGLSSMGGLLGAIIAAVWFFRARRIRFGDYADAFAVGMPIGWGIARLGCFSVHDHPGVRSDFALALAFPGGARHDLGLYEAVVLFAIGATTWTLHRRGILRGRLMGLLAVLYGVARFLLDFLRARDVVAGPRFYAAPDGRQWGLTFAQWFAFALVAWGVWALVRRRPGGTRRA